MNVVNSFNDWDPLEEVIVGVIDGFVGSVPSLPWLSVLRREMLAQFNEMTMRHILALQGKPQDSTPEATAAKAEIAEFVRILEAEGVTVRRPDPVDNTRPYVTPDFTSVSGFAQVCPRDILLVVGDEILEAPMSFRSRYFEYRPYRRLIREYFEKGCKWSAAPKPLMTDELYNPMYERGKEYVLTELEPVFDAADVCRVGKDLFVQPSNVTNRSGIEWLRRHFAPTYNVHTLETVDERAIHVDATFVPLRPGKLLINPARVKVVPEVFKKAGWDILEATPSMWASERGFEWLNMNMLSLDEERICVEKSEEKFIAQLRDWGFKPIPIAFNNVYQFGGSFHCVTADIRRKGTLKSYL